MGEDTDLPFSAAERITARQFEAIPEGPPYYQLLEYQLLQEPSPDVWHQNACFELARRLADFVDTHRLGKVMISPIDVYFDEGNVFQPDIIFVSEERRHIRQAGRHIQGAPDLVVEVLSTNWRRDVLDKRYIYELYDVREYWIVDPRKRSVEVLENVKRAFVSLQRATDDEIVRSNLLTGFAVEVNAIFRE